jgi:hypothetical protein
MMLLAPHRRSDLMLSGNAPPRAASAVTATINCMVNVR